MIFWSLGNESGYGPNHDAAAGWVRGARPVAAAALRGRDQAGLDAAGRRATDVVCPMYAEVDSIEAWAARRPTTRGR